MNAGTQRYRLDVISFLNISKLFRWPIMSAHLLAQWSHLQPLPLLFLKSHRHGLAALTPLDKSLTDKGCVSFFGVLAFEFSQDSPIYFPVENSGQTSPWCAPIRVRHTDKQAYQMVRGRTWKNAARKEEGDLRQFPGSAKLFYTLDYC